MLSRLVMLLTAALCCCCPAYAGLKQHQPAVSEPNGAIIFVHGWYGSAEDTFGKEPNWLSLLATDNEPTVNKVLLSKYDRFTLSYEEHKSGHLSLPDLTTRLIHEIEHHPNLDRYGNLFIIAHSTGGILAQSLLPQIPHLSKRTKAIFFIAVPSHGVDFGILAKLYLYLKKEPILAIDEKSLYLSQVRGMWNSYLQEHRNQPPFIFCAHETKPMTILDLVNVHIVTEKDAATQCERRSYPVPQDHIEIVKPRDKLGIYKWVKDNINWAIGQEFKLSSQRKLLEDARLETEGLRGKVREVESQLKDAREELSKRIAIEKGKGKQPDEGFLRTQIEVLSKQLSSSQDELRKANEKLADAERNVKAGRPPDVQAAQARPGGTGTANDRENSGRRHTQESHHRVGVERQLHIAILRYLDNIKISRSEFAQNIGKNLGKLYRASPPARAVSVCIQWATSKLDAPSLLRVETDMSTIVKRSEDAVRESTMERCNAWRQRTKSECECMLADVNGVPDFQVPEDWLTRYVR